MRFIALVASLICGFLGILSQPCAAANNGLDSTFGSAGVVALPPTPTSGVSLSVSTLLALANGKILVGGYANGGGQYYQAALGRLNDDGSWDTGFADHGLFILPSALATSVQSSGDDYLHSIGALSDGSVVASGGRLNSLFGYGSCTTLFKLDSSGALDSGFGPNHNGAFCFDFPIATTTGVLHPDHLTVDTDDTIYLAMAGSTGLPPFSSGVARFDSVGNLVSSYGNNGVLMFPPDAFMYLPRLLPTHDLIVTGTRDIADAPNVYSMDIVNFHLTAAGQIDHGYGTDGVYTFGQVTTKPFTPIFSALDSQGRQLVTDYDVFHFQTLGIARALAGGSTDPTFNANNQQPGTPGYAMPSLSGDPTKDSLLAAQPVANGQIFVVAVSGYVAPGDGTSNLALLRLNDDASFDSGFGDAAHPGWASINIGTTSSSRVNNGVFAMDASGRGLVVVDVSNDVNGNRCQFLLRAIPDRVFDDAFDAPASSPPCPQ